MDNSKLELLTPQNSVLLLVDYQPSMFKGIGSGDRTNIRNAALAVAKTAKILDVPVVLSSINPDHNGDFLSDFTDLFPKQKVLARPMPSFDALEDPKTMEAISQTGRQKIVMAGLWTSMCFTHTALGALRAGFEVYGIMDATGDATLEAHRYGIKRMLQAGVVPMNWMATVTEWMHDWANPKSGEIIKEVYNKYDAMMGM